MFLGIKSFTFIYLQARTLINTVLRQTMVPTEASVNFSFQVTGNTSCSRLANHTDTVRESRTQSTAPNQVPHRPGLFSPALSELPRQKRLPACVLHRHTRRLVKLVTRNARRSYGHRSESTRSFTACTRFHFSSAVGAFSSVWRYSTGDRGKFAFFRAGRLRMGRYVFSVCLLLITT